MIARKPRLFVRLAGAVALLAATIVAGTGAIHVTSASSTAAVDTIWPSSAVPATPDSGDGNSVELGVAFRSDVAGSVSGVRFYKSAANTGTHFGELWTSSGTQLASVTFTQESAAGWQEADFAAPVAIQAGTTYVASYWAPNGHYSEDDSAAGLSNGVDSVPLHAIADSVTPNGLYVYGSNSFPTQGFHASNYWVDVAFTPSTSAPPPPTTTTTVPGSTTSTSRPSTTTTSTSRPSTTTTTVVSGGSGGFPDASNTGYRNAPGYPGSLHSCPGPIQSNTTYSFCDFAGGLYIGSADTHPVNVTFFGSRFSSNSVQDANVADYGDNIVFSYDTFQPSVVSAPPVAFGQGYEWGVDLRYAGQLTMDHSDLWGFAAGIQFSFSTQAKPLVVRNSWFHDSSDAGSGSGQYHNDGILCSDGGPSYMVFDHNTIASVGNTNGLALQTVGGGTSGTPYDHVTITNNYFSGFGYTVNSGGGTNSTNMTFTGNTFGTDFQPSYGPLYGNEMYTTPGLGSLWQNNKWRVVPGTTWNPASNDGKYWWPDGTLSTTDYPGP